MATKFHPAAIRKMVWNKYLMIYGILPRHAAQDNWTTVHRTTRQFMILDRPEMEARMGEIYLRYTEHIAGGFECVVNPKGSEVGLHWLLTVGGLHEHSSRVWRWMQREGLAADCEPVMARMVIYFTHVRPQGFRIRSIRTNNRGFNVPTTRRFLPYLPYKGYQLEDLLMRILPKAEPKPLAAEPLTTPSTDSNVLNTTSS